MASYLASGMTARSDLCRDLRVSYRSVGAGVNR